MLNKEIKNQPKGGFRVKVVRCKFHAPSTRKLKISPKMVGLVLRLLGADLAHPQHLVLGRSPLPLKIIKGGITKFSPILTTSTL
jgi:hypothetical protein